jgi:hypothetical protein
MNDPTSPNNNANPYINVGTYSSTITPSITDTSDIILVIAYTGPPSPIDIAFPKKKEAATDKEQAIIPLSISII